MTQPAKGVAIQRVGAAIEKYSDSHTHSLCIENIGILSDDAILICFCFPQKYILHTAQLPGTTVSRLVAACALRLSKKN